jgi:hypothetical protein
MNLIWRVLTQQRERKTIAALKSEGVLSMAELDRVAAAGGKAGASTNPVGD